MAAKLNTSLFAFIAVHADRRRRSLWLLALVAVTSLLMLAGFGSSGSTAKIAAEDPITVALKLALGTLHLEGTDQAVDATTAAQLLPLWQLMDELSKSSAASPAEITAVIEQIESTMISSQLKTIEAMNLTESDVAKTSQGSGVPTAAATTTAGSNALAASAGGAVLIGAMGAPGMPLDGGGPMPSASSSQNSLASGNTGASGNPSLIQEVILLLERKLQN